jgi:RNA polymerase sigma-32 factor
MFARDNRTRSIWLAQALAELTDREQTIIKERRLRDDARTLEELGRDLGISKERVRQIEHRALEKLKVSLLERTVEPDDAVPRV